jgi:hypothetical protein
LQLRTNDARSHDQAITLLDSSLQALSPVKDNDVLHAIEEAAMLFPESRHLQAISAAMWEKTLKARPNDDGLLDELFERKIFAMDWDAARKVRLALIHQRWPVDEIPASDDPNENEARLVFSLCHMPPFVRSVKAQQPSR